jgi:LacI family transcriptional regulator
MSRPGRAMTMKDVARVAGVGVGTVSRALTGSGQVSPATRERVLAAARELDYRPSALGRGLKMARTNNIGLVVADISNNFYGEFAEGLLAEAKTMGKHVIVCASGEDAATEREYVEVLLQQRVDGIIAFPTGQNLELWRGAERLGVHLIFVDRLVDGLAQPTLVADNVGGTLAAVEYLLALGHQRIGFLAGPSTLTSGQQREQGFRQAHARAGVPVTEQLVVRTRFTRDTAHASALRLLRAWPRPTALFASNNVLGEAALAAVLESGLRVPEDISLVMFDDVPWARLTRPPVTVVSQPARRMGVEAARMLGEYDRWRGAPPRIFPTDFVIRGSCRAVPAG